MKTDAPGKLLLTGAYAVLEGAPAIVLAVDRLARADLGRAAGSPTAEVRAAFGDAPCPEVDVRQLQDTQGRKLGLGSSAAGVVAAIAARWAAKGHSLAAPAVRRSILREARSAHASIQAGGSGVDIAASVYGGALRFELGEPDPRIRALAPPLRLYWSAYVSPERARTSDLRARVAAGCARNPRAPGLVAEMCSVSTTAADAFEAGDADSFVVAAGRFGELLDALGQLADAPIVSEPVRALSLMARAEGAAFLPSGAGGGDVSVWLGARPAPQAFEARAHAEGLCPLTVSLDIHGVRLHEDGASASGSKV